MLQVWGIRAACGLCVGALVSAAAYSTCFGQEDGSAAAGDLYTSVFDDVSANSGRSLQVASKIHATLASEFDKAPQDHRVKSWVLFKDKAIASRGAYDAAIRQTSSQSNPRAAERRLKRRTLPDLYDEHDLPVVQTYIDQVEATGAVVRHTSKWINGVSVLATQAQVELIGRLPYVKIIQPVRRAMKVEPIDAGKLSGDADATETRGAYGEEDFYGLTRDQLEQMNLIGVHDLGFTGRGVLIGVLDTGFVTTHEAFNDPVHPLKVVAEWDFINSDDNVGIEPGDPGGQHSHGTYILGTLAAYIPGFLIGGAYDASFVLCKTEDTAGEYPAEEDNYVAALEFIEAFGVDVATSSLGYIDWYSQDDLDGLTAVTTIAVNIATGNGIHFCNAAGNEGSDSIPSTSHLLAPSDALQVIACGAVNSTGTTATFSSDGPSADGRVKPELLARGVSTFTVPSNSDIGVANLSGTSLSTPLVAGVVACLAGAFPDWTVDKMREELFRTASYSVVVGGGFDPLYIRGYGIVNALDAMRADCNDNEVDDFIDIDTGTSEDCNVNGLPDECEGDCDGDGIPNDCEVEVAQRDCDSDGVCNGVEIAECAAFDHVCRDCNSNDIPDGCEIDCNRNRVADACDLAGDMDGDGIISLGDQAVVGGCLSGPCGDPPCVPALYTSPCCTLADLDSDGDGDLRDFSVFQREISPP